MSTFIRRYLNRERWAVLAASVAGFALSFLVCTTVEASVATVPLDAATASGWTERRATALDDVFASAMRDLERRVAARAIDVATERGTASSTTRANAHRVESR